MMNPAWLGFTVGGLCLMTAVGCGDDAATDFQGGSGNAGTGAAGNASAAETCEAIYVVLQKDAYKETAGRTSPLWPPHTTTTMTVQCAGEGDAPVEVDRAIQANHGTEPDDVDADGDVFLVEMKRTTVAGTRDELSALLDAYRACTCESSTAFLSLDALGDAAVQDLLGTLVGYIDANLTCSGGTDTQALIGLLQQGQIEEVLAVLPNCTWAGGTHLEAGLSEALEELVAVLGETLAGYHVCNNDAVLQADLVARFASEGVVAACDAATPTCSGPQWFYEP